MTLLALIMFSATPVYQVYPDRLNYIDQVLDSSAELLAKFKENRYSHILGVTRAICLTNFFPRLFHSVDYSQKGCVAHILSLLNIPLNTYNNVLVLLKLKNYSTIISYLSYSTSE